MNASPMLADLSRDPRCRVLVGVKAVLVPEVIGQCSERGVPYSIISPGFAESNDPAARMISLEKAKGHENTGSQLSGLVNLPTCPVELSASLTAIGAPRSVATFPRAALPGFASLPWPQRAVSANTNNHHREPGGSGSSLILMVFTADPEVRLLVLYVEGLSDGAKVHRMLRFAESGMFLSPS